MHPESAAKIESDDLRRMVSGNSDEPIGVLIQPRLPHRTVEVQRVVRKGVEIDMPTGVTSTSVDDQHLIERRIAETSAFLKDVLGTSPHWLSSSRSFVVRATPAQLRVITESPLIESIWPNRELRPTAASTPRS